jgi:amino acid transporter
MPESPASLPRELGPRELGQRELGLRDVVLFNVAAVVSIRWIATAAHIGPGALSLWAGAAVLFFVPLALAVAGLNAKYPCEGGIYTWTGISFGEWHGFLCGWCYWLSNLFFFPNLLLAGIGMALYSLFPANPALADNRLLVGSISLAALWVALVTNLVGMKIGKWTQNLGAIATCVAGLAIIVAGLVALARHGGATPLRMAPEWNWSNLNFWSQIAFAFGGLELGAILSGEIRDPGRTVRRAAWISCLMIGGFYILGTLSILALLPPERISVVTGLAQAGEAAAVSWGLPWLTPFLGALIVVGVMGQFGAWVGGSARLAFSIGLDRYLPASFGRLHPRWHTPHVALLSMGVASTLFLLLMQLGDSLRTAYQLLVDVTVVTYFIPFVYLFAAAWKHGQRWSAVPGLAVTLAGIAFSFVPPGDVRSVWLFELKLVGSTALLAATAWAVFLRGRSRRERITSELKVGRAAESTLPR